MFNMEKIKWYLQGDEMNLAVYSTLNHTMQHNSNVNHGSRKERKENCTVKFQVSVQTSIDFQRTHQFSSALIIIEIKIPQIK